ncbi:MAG: hypothetical protein M5U09_20685 [Gammaproteobacteria bacterium]|nr:hypothetical protein [Gammaproteobacteria bacterium]
MYQAKPEIVHPLPGLPVADDDGGEAANDEQHDGEVQQQDKVGDPMIDRFGVIPEASSAGFDTIDPD